MSTQIGRSNLTVGGSQSQERGATSQSQNDESSPSILRDGTSRNGRSVPPVARRKRKFPGPAGLLPDLEPDVISNLNILNNNNSTLCSTVSQIIITDQELHRHMQRSRLSPGSNSFSHFSTQGHKGQSLLLKYPWLDLLQQLELTSEFPNNLIDFMNINWVRTTASQLVHCQIIKIPFLTVVLEEAPELPSSKLGQKKTPCVRIRDATGTIEAALDPTFVKLNGRYLQPGTALALKNVGLMRHSRRLTVSIASKNVIYLASKLAEPAEDSPASSQDPEQENENQGNGSSTERLNNAVSASTSRLNANNNKNTKISIPQDTFLTENGVKIFKFCDYSSERIMENYKTLTDPKFIRQLYQKLQQDSESVNDDSDLHQNRGRLPGGSTNNSNNNSSRKTASNSSNNNNLQTGQLFTSVSSFSRSSSSQSSSNFNGRQGGDQDNSNHSENQLQNSEAMSNFEFNFDDDDEDDEFFRNIDFGPSETLPSAAAAPPPLQNETESHPIPTSQAMKANLDDDHVKNDIHAGEIMEGLPNEGARPSLSPSSSPHAQQQSPETLSAEPEIQIAVEISVSEEQVSSSSNDGSEKQKSEQVTSSTRTTVNSQVSNKTSDPHSCDFDESEDEFDREFSNFDDSIIVSQNIVNVTKAKGTDGIIGMDSDSDSSQPEPSQFAESESNIDNNDDDDGNGDGDFNVSDEEDFFTQFDKDIDAV